MTGPTRHSRCAFASRYCWRAPITKALRRRPIARSRMRRESGDDYVMVQVLNILGAFHFDCATSKLAEPHARAHLSSLDPRDVAPMETDAREALRYFERARGVAERAHYEFAAWYVAGNIERLEIILGHADRRCVRYASASRYCRRAARSTTKS